MGIDITVIIPTFNRHRALIRTLDSLMCQSVDPHRFKVIVVDDGSSDGTAELLAGRELPFALQVIRLPCSRGASHARNCGLARASSDLILFLDDDMVCSPEAIERHLEYHARGGPQAVIGRILQIPSDTALTRWFDSRNPTSREETLPATRFTTQNVSMSAPLLRQVGGFDERYQQYGLEDIDLALRLTTVPGCRLRYAGEALAYHYHNQTLAGYRAKWIQTGRHNLRYFCKKFQPEIRTLRFGRFLDLPGESGRARKLLLRAALSLPGLGVVLVGMAGRLPVCAFTDIAVRYLFASSLLQGYREDQRERAATALGLAVNPGPPSWFIGLIKKRGSRLRTRLLQNPFLAWRR